MLRSLLLLATFSLVVTLNSHAQVGQMNPQNSFPTNDSLVLVSAEYLALLIRGQQNDEMVTDETLIDLEEALRDIENKKLEEAGLHIYPEATPDYLHLDLSYDNDYVVNLYNADNEVVINLEQAFGSNQLNLHDLAAGSYKLELIAGDKKYTKRIEKE